MPAETNTSNPQESDISESDTQASNPKELSTSGGLSAGAKGGIAAGVIIAVFILLPIGFLRRQHRKKILATEEGIAQSEKRGKTGAAELDGKTALRNISANTSDDPYIAELDSRNTVDGHHSSLSELDGINTLAASPPPEDRGGATTSPNIASAAGPSPKDDRAVSPEAEQSSAQQRGSNPGTRRVPSATTSTIQGVSTSGSAEELTQIMKVEKELNERWRSLEKLKHVQDQQAFIRGADKGA